MSVTKIFEKFDKNKDGKFSWDEFADAIRVFSPLMSSEETDKMFKELDVDGNGHIDAVEFASCMVVDGSKENDDRETVLKYTFDLYDIDRDGRISASEIHGVLKRLGEKHSLEECVKDGTRHRCRW